MPIKRSRRLTREDEKEIADALIEHNRMTESDDYISHNRLLIDTRVELKCKNDKQKSLKKAIEDNEVVIASGSAGTGKTFIACAMALKLLKRSDKYKKIYLVKSVTALDGESIGYLPGNLDEKLDPFMF